MPAISIANASFMALEKIADDRARSRSGAPNPTRGKVHPHSRLAGTFEDDFFYSYPKGETDRIYNRVDELLEQKNAIRRLARAEGRELTDDERLITMLTPAAKKVLQKLAGLARNCAGKIFPTWKWIEEATGLSRATVGRALTILTTLGILDKQRRCVPIEPTAERPRARFEQTSNVYRMQFPNRLVRFLSRKLRPVPLPDDVVQREADRADDIAAMRLWRSPRQVIAEDVGDEGLRRVLQSLRVAVENKESQKNGQPLLDSYSLYANGVGLVGQRGNA